MWKHIQPILDQNRRYFTLTQTAEYAFFLKDADPESTFYFNVGFPNPNDGSYSMTIVPADDGTVTGKSLTGDLQVVVNELRAWFKTLQEYDELETVYDDPILKSYEAEFAGYFKMDNEQADKTPFDFERQVLFGNYLSRLAYQLSLKQESVGEEKQAELTDIIAECKTLEDVITDLTQNQAVGRLAKIWAKIRKVSLELVKDALADFRKEALKQLAQTVMKGEIPGWQNISQHLGPWTD